MSMENIENLANKEAEEQTSLDFGMAPEEAMEISQEPDTTGVKINLEDVGAEVSAVDGE